MGESVGDCQDAAVAQLKDEEALLYAVPYRTEILPPLFF